MAKNKTAETNADVAAFINSFADTEQKKADSFELVKLMEAWSGCKAKMWGPSIIGFGSYHYKYASGHEGDSPLIGFSPRKAALTLYVFQPLEKNMHLLNHLGKFKMSKACIYVKKLSDISIDALKKICLASINDLQNDPSCACHA